MALTAADLDIDEAIDLLTAEKELPLCRSSCARFIRRWVYIEDKDLALGADAPGVRIKFHLWPQQMAALAAILTKRLLAILKARQLGLTWLVLAYAVWRMLFFPGYTVVALSKKEDPDAKELVRRVAFILRHLPPIFTMERTSEHKDQLRRYSGPTWDATTLKVTIYHPADSGGVEQSTFTSMSAAPDSGRSFTANLVILDEWAFQPFAADIFNSAYPTINRPTGGQVIGLSTNVRGSFFEGIVAKSMKKLNNFALVFVPWWADPRRDSAWYEQTKTDLPHSYRQEYPSTPEEAMSAGEGTAFPEFTEQIHVCKPFAIPAWWRRWRGNDPGYADPFCYHWFAVSPDGIVYLYREYTRSEKDPRVTYSDQAREVLKLSVVGGEVGRPDLDVHGKPVPEDHGFTVVGRDAWAKLGRAFDYAGKSIVDCYVEGGLMDCVPPQTNQQQARTTRKAVFHEYLKPFVDERTGRTIAKLQIFSTCARIIEALPNLVVDPKDSEKVALDPHMYTNAYDCAGYSLVAWSAQHSKPPKEEPTGDAARIQKHVESLIKKKSMRRHRV